MFDDLFGSRPQVIRGVWGFSGPPSYKRLAFSIQAPETWPRELQTHRTAWPALASLPMRSCPTAAGPRRPARCPRLTASRRGAPAQLAALINAASDSVNYTVQVSGLCRIVAQRLSESQQAACSEMSSYWLPSNDMNYTSATTCRTERAVWIVYGAQTIYLQKKRTYS